MRLPLRTAVLGLALFTLAGCDSGDPDARSIGGTYSAFVDGAFLSDQIPPGVLIEFEAVIPSTESGAFVFGGDVSATLGTGTLSYDFTGTGTYNHPEVTMRVFLTFPTNQTVNLAGVASEDRGTLTLSDEDGLFVTLRRR